MLQTINSQKKKNGAKYFYTVLVYFKRFNAGHGSFLLDQKNFCPIQTSVI